MNQTLLFDGKTYISVSRASKKLDYTADYIGQLCRAGKVDARMIGRTWYVEWESIKNHKKNKKHRVRRTAEEIKKARETEMSYLTPAASTDGLAEQKDKDCPPEEYLEKVDATIAKEKAETQIQAFVEPVSNLIPLSALRDNKSESLAVEYTPSESLNNVNAALPLTYSYDSKSEWLPKLSKTPKLVSKTKGIRKTLIVNPHTISVGLLGIFIFVNAIYLGLSVASPQTLNGKFSINERLTRPGEIIPSLQLSMKESLEPISQANIAAAYSNVATVFNHFTNELRRRINSWAMGYLRSLGFVPQIEPTAITQKQGLVVVPDAGNHRDTVASIRDTFSDEVIIEEDPEGGSGVIIPKFKNTEGEPYTYVLVPLPSP